VTFARNRFRIRHSKAIFLTVTLAWTPIFIVAMKELLAFDVYRLFGRFWIVANAARSLPILPVLPHCPLTTEPARIISGRGDIRRLTSGAAK
jgi:hypothetical protein